MYFRAKQKLSRWEDFIFIEVTMKMEECTRNENMSKLSA